MTSLDDPRDPAWNAAERALFTRFRDAARELVNPRVAAHESSRSFDRASFAALGAMGLFEHGARGLSPLFAALEGLSTGCDDAGFAISVIAHAGVAVPVIHEFAHPSLRDRILPRAISGEHLVAVANAEPTGGTDVLGVRARVRPVGGRLTLSGRKRSITNVGRADVILVSARDEGSPDATRSIAAYAVDASAKGCHQRPRVDRMGLWTSPTGDLIARNVTLSDDARLCDGVDFFRRCFALERLAVGALYVGALRRALRRMTAWLSSRPSLAEHQYVQQRVVRVRCSLAAVEAMLFATRRMFLSGERCEAELSTLKCEGAERALDAAEDAIRLMGARGYEHRAGAEKDARDLMGLTMLGGTAELHQGVIFRAAKRGG